MLPVLGARHLLSPLLSLSLSLSLCLSLSLPGKEALLLLPQSIRGVSGPPAYWPPLCSGEALFFFFLPHSQKRSTDALPSARERALLVSSLNVRYSMRPEGDNCCPPENP